MRHRVVHQRLDPSGDQMPLQFAAAIASRRPAAPDDEQVVHMPGIHFIGKRHRRGCERRAVLGCQRPAPRGPLREERKAGTHDRGLHFVEPRIDARLLMPIPIGLAAVSQPLDARRERLIVGHDGAAVAERAEILRRIEAERSRDADCADRTPGSGREMRLTAILDDGKRVPGCDPLDRRHVGGLSVQMNGQNGARPRRHGALDRVGIDRQPPGVDVGKHRASAGHHDREGGIGCRERCRDDLIAGPDAERAKDQGEGVGAVPDADRMRRPARGGKLGFERFDFRPEDKPAARDDTINRGTDGPGVVVRRKRQKRNPRLGSPGLRGTVGSIDVPIVVLAVEREGAQQSLSQPDGGCPAGRSA